MNSRGKPDRRGQESKPSLGREPGPGLGRGGPGRGQGRKAIYGEPMRTTSVTLPAELVERLAAVDGSRSEVIRTALELYLGLLEEPAEVFAWLDVACAPAGDPPEDAPAWVHQVRRAIMPRA